MMPLHETLRESVRELFARFGNVSVETLPGPEACDADWSICARIECDGPNGGHVTVLASPALTGLMTENVLALESASRHKQREDVTMELANILAGFAYEALRSGRRPTCLGTPRLLTPEQAMQLWDKAAPEERIELYSDAHPIGGLLVCLSQEFSSAWE